MLSFYNVCYLNKKYGWQIPVGDYDTLEGFIISVTECIPRLHQKIDIAGLSCTSRNIYRDDPG
ncbi:MAG: hypothetical protein BGO68_01515 [Candidatus Amoebophilus sp. 36-38]|nr:MAG: hypothetical protein BGO68_01515 [Candidatus Amoebophilus sp. 36-38]